MDFLTQHAQRQPSHPAVIAGNRVLTYAQLEEQANRLANALLDLGLRPLDRCTTIGYNAAEHFLVSAATRKLVMVSLPMNYRLNQEEIHYQLAHSESAVLFAGPEQVERVAAAAASCPRLQHRITWGNVTPPQGWLQLEDLLAGAPATPPEIEAGLTGPTMTYTAGTTGNPKGAYRAEGTSPEVIQNYVRWFDLRPGDVHLVAGPLYHSAPAAFAAFTLILGGTNVVLHRFDADAALAAIERHHVTTTFVAPILLQRLAQRAAQGDADHDLSSLRSIIVAAAPCPFEVKRAALELFGPVLYEFYGSSEVGCNTVMRPSEQLLRPGSCGRVCDGVEIRVLDDAHNELPIGQAGELFIKSPQQITEYWHNPQATAEAQWDGYFSVGDVGYFDADGYLYIVDRKRDMVISGGVNICTTEVENVIHQHPDVWDVVVIGVPSAEWGESVHAIVEPQPGAAHLTSEELDAWLRPRIADYKRPRSIEIRGPLPRDEAGKVRKRELREPYWAGHERRV